MQPVSDESRHLRDYTRAKHEVVAVVRAAQRLWQEMGQPDQVATCQDMLVRLAEDRFDLAVVGQFNRGKSSLMNAVIGRALLPTGLLPLTSAITALCYGAEERVLLRRVGWAREQEVSLEELADYITERGNPGNEKGVLEAHVEVPVPFLRRGLYFVDTPGIGSVHHANTVTTYQFLPHAAAVIFVTSVDPPLTETEEAFLEDLREQVRAVIVVVNKVDLLGIDERDAVLGYVRARVEEALGAQTFQIHPLSARQALDAKVREDDTALRASGLSAFENALATFLAEEQGRALLLSILDRLLALFPDVSMSAGTTRSADEREEIPSHAAQDALAGLREQVGALRDALLVGSSLAAVQARPGGQVASSGHLLEEAVAASRARQVGAAPRTRRPPSDSCPVCAAQLEAVFAFFAQWQNTLARSEAAQRALIQTHGFCPVHTWQFQQLASPQGLSTGYAPLIEATRDALQRLLDAPGASPIDHAGAITALLGSSATCPACQVLRQTEQAQIPLWLATLATASGPAGLADVAGVCLPHLQAALVVASDDTVTATLERAQVQRLDEIAEDLREYTLKRAALRHGLTDAREEQAWRRALMHLVGERNARIS